MKWNEGGQRSPQPEVRDFFLYHRVQMLFELHPRCILWQFQPVEAGVAARVRVAFLQGYFLDCEFIYHIPIALQISES